MLKEQGIEMDKRVILLLQPRADGGFISFGTYFDAPPGHALDDTAQEIVNTIRDGGFLEIQATQGLGDIFAEELRRADTIVRAKLLEVDDKAAHWQVEKTLRGKDITTPLDLPHDVFRLRAQAVVNYAALTDNTLKDPAKRDAQIAAEMQAMIKAELAPGHEAILFLAKVTFAGNTAHADLLYRLFDTSPRLTLAALEAAIPPVGAAPGNGAAVVRGRPNTAPTVAALGDIGLGRLGLEAQLSRAALISPIVVLSN